MLHAWGLAISSPEEPGGAGVGAPGVHPGEGRVPKAEGVVLSLVIFIRTLSPGDQTLFTWVRGKQQESTWMVKSSYSSLHMQDTKAQSPVCGLRGCEDQGGGEPSHESQGL